MVGRGEGARLLPFLPIPLDNRNVLHPQPAYRARYDVFCFCATGPRNGEHPIAAGLFTYPPGLSSIRYQSGCHFGNYLA